MQLHLENMDARDVVADIQFVKHFNGRYGGAEAVLDNETGGRIQQLFHKLESPSISSQIIKVPHHAKVRSEYLLVLGLGRMSQFSIPKLRSGLIHALDKSLQRNFQKIATPIIGTNPHVGLNIQEAFPITLTTILDEILKYNHQSQRKPSVTDITIFDFDADKIRYFNSITESILTNSRKNFQRSSRSSFQIFSEFDRADYYHRERADDFFIPFLRLSFLRTIV